MSEFDVLEWFQLWASKKCDAGWEHGLGVRIEMIDNPGWKCVVDIRDCLTPENTFDEITIERDENDWISCYVKDGYFYGYGGILNLKEILYIFYEAIVGKPYS